MQDQDMQARLQAQLDALSRMQDQRDQLAAQLKDATQHCGVMAELLREAIPYVDREAEIAPSKQISGYHETLVAHMKESLTGKLPELRITKPARIGGVVFQPGIKASSVIEAAYLAAEYHEPNLAAFHGLQAAMLAAATKSEGGGK